jgi:hypothetical protein
MSETKVDWRAIPIGTILVHRVVTHFPERTNIGQQESIDFWGVIDHIGDSGVQVVALYSVEKARGPPRIFAQPSTHKRISGTMMHRFVPVTVVPSDTCMALRPLFDSLNETNHIHFPHDVSAWRGPTEPPITHGVADAILEHRKKVVTCSLASFGPATFMAMDTRYDESWQVHDPRETYCTWIREQDPPQPMSQELAMNDARIRETIAPALRVQSFLVARATASIMLAKQLDPVNVIRDIVSHAYP